MPRLLMAAAFAALLAFAQQPLPELRIEAIDGGSVFYVRNGASQPLTAYLIELVNYPGSSYALWRDDFADPLPPGAERRIQVANMTIGAAPEYVRMQAAIYGDGTSAGVPDKVGQFVERRRRVLETTRQLIDRIEKAQSGAMDKAALLADLEAWENSIPSPTRQNRASAAMVAHNAARDVIAEARKALETGSFVSVIESLGASRDRLAASKPAL
ncbi:MAG: hypothetical protein JSU00_22305 [Acidobacteria bacterium]|nr:hypothetical protein [Acidobacteriota bacterium]